MIISSTKTKVVGVNIGYEEINYAIVDVRGKILAESSFPMPTDKDINGFIALLCDGITNLILENDSYENIRSIGISVPSGNFTTGSIVNSLSLPWKGEIPLAAMLRDRLGLAVAVGNSAHVRAIGESTYGCVHGMNDFIVITLGHGFGSCMFSNGHVHMGNNGFAGEIGHCCVEPEGRLCRCGRRGCLETYCASDGIVLTARELMASTDKPSLLRDLEELTPKTIHECCERGDELAIEVYNKTGFVLGLGLANYASIANPEAIIITGGISNAGKWLYEPTNASFEEHVFHNIADRVKIMRSSLPDNERDVLGASALAWNVKEYSLFK